MIAAAPAAAATEVQGDIEDKVCIDMLRNPSLGISCSWAMTLSTHVGR
jgi:hypothetical protein